MLRLKEESQLKLGGISMAYSDRRDRKWFSWKRAPFAHARSLVLQKILPLFLKPCFTD
jgi:hypothetical protein